MRMPAFLAEQRESRRVLKGALEEVRPLLERARAAFNDFLLEMEGSTRAFFASGDTAQLNQGVEAVRENLEACEAAVPILEQFEESFSLAPAFDSVKRRFLTGNESREELEYFSDHEAARWLAGRVVGYARHVDEQLVPWLKTALDEVRDWIVKRQGKEDQAPARAEAARRRLEEVRASHPEVQWVRAANRLAEIEARLQQMEEARRLQHHQGIVAAADGVIAAADALERSLDEGLAFLQEPDARLLEAEDLLTQLAVFYAQRNMAQPEPLQQARQLLQQAREKSQQPPQWTEAILAYNQASELYELAASGVGEVVA